MASPRSRVSYCESTHLNSLAKTIRGHQYVSLKLYTRDEDNQEEFQIYKQLSQGSSWHPGHSHVRKALDVFTVSSLKGSHACLVQIPTWESFGDLLYRNPSHRFTEDLLEAGLMQILLALDYLHTECKLVHTGKIALAPDFRKALQKR